MFSKPIIENMLFFDLETTANTEKFTDQPESIQEIWKDRCNYLRSMDKYPKNATMTDQELWADKAPLQAEYGRICCISFGRINLEVPSEPSIQVKSFFGTDEVDMLKKFAIGLDKMYVKNANTRLIGHNSKRFDIPFLSKRLIINGIDLPSCLNQWNKKPWEMSMLDSAEIWSFGSWQEGFASLKLLTQILGLPSPKDDMCGADVYKEYWEKKNYTGIKTYCEKDVIALAKTILRLANYEIGIVNAMQIK